VFGPDHSFEKSPLTLNADWPARSTDIGGPDTMWAYPYNFFGDIPYENITLAYELVMGELAATVNVSQVMDTTSGVLCYIYE
jgi:tyrosinase